MEPINILSKKLIYLLAPVSFLLLASCGSYQYSGYETDGIYGDANRGSERQNQNAKQGDNRNYYQSLFAEEAALYGDVLAEGAIFTDVESYSSTGEYQPGEQQASNYQGGNAPWGNDPDSYSINIYNNGFYGGYGFMDPFWMGGFYGIDPFFGPGYWGPGYWGPGYWGPGYWRNPWAVGYGGSFGYGFGFGVHPFIYGAGGWHNPYNFYGNRFYPNHNRNVAYNSGRREATTSYRNTNSNNVRNATVLDSRGRNSSYSRSIRNLRNSNDNYGLTRRRTVSRDYNYSDRNYSTRVNSNSPYRSNRNQTINRSSRRSDTYSTPTGTRSTSPAVRSSTTTRSSGAVRSSGGGRTSSGGSRGRGN